MCNVHEYQTSIHFVYIFKVTEKCQKSRRHSPVAFKRVDFLTCMHAGHAGILQQALTCGSIP